MNINSVRSSSVDPWSSHDDDTQPAATPATPAVPRDASAIPQLPDVHAGLLAKAAQTAQSVPSAPRAPAPQAASTPHLLLATGLKAADVAPTTEATKTHVIMARLDAFMQSATPTYHIAGEGDVAVAVPFRMYTDPPAFPAQEERVAANRPERQRIAGANGISPGELDAIDAGRGSPAAIHKITQGLLDAGRLPAPSGPQESLFDRVRRMMCDYGLGVDCAGYTQQAFLYAHGVTRADAGFNPAIQDEGLALSHNPRFTSVAPQNATAGDIIALGPPKGFHAGHRVIVYERRDVTAADVESLKGPTPDLQTLRNGRVSILEVDSSWGSAGVPTWGGVKRQQWLYDASSGRWGTINDGRVRFFAEPGQPYDGQHQLLGVYHFKSATLAKGVK